MLGNYSKLIASLLGSVIAIILVYLGTKGIATCVADASGEQSCTLFGFSTAQITGAATALVSAIFVWAFPANKPSS